MQHEGIWKWLDAVEQEYLDPLDQWGIPPPRRRTEITPPREVASHLQYAQPAGILLRNGSIRATNQNPKFVAHDVKNDNHPQSLLPGFPTHCARRFEGENHPQSLEPGFSTKLEKELESENHPRSLRPGFRMNIAQGMEDGDCLQSPIPAFTTSAKVTGQRTDASQIRQLQTSGREGNSRSANPKRLPSFTERAGVHGLSRALHSTPITPVEVKDPVAIECQGARLVGGHQQNVLRTPLATLKKSWKNMIDGDGALQRSNATKRHASVRAGRKAHPKD